MNHVHVEADVNINSVVVNRKFVVVSTKITRQTLLNAVKYIPWNKINYNTLRKRVRYEMYQREMPCGASIFAGNSRRPVPSDSNPVR